MGIVNWSWRNLILPFWTWRCYLLAGISLGCLVGLSISPVVQGVITGLTGLLVAAAGLVIETKPDGKTDASDVSALSKIKISIPVMTAIAVGITVGSCLGLIARTHNWLGRSTLDIVKEWEGYGLSKEEVSRRLLAFHFPQDDGKSGDGKPAEDGDKKKGASVASHHNAALGALMSDFAKADDGEKVNLCLELHALKLAETEKERKRFEEQLEARLTRFPSEAIRKKVGEIKNDKLLLRALAEALCGSK
jgi:hypothetical protein